MDVRNVELSMEHILFIHRHWITKLYLDDLRSEDEIVDQLNERRLPVTAPQIQKCLAEWNLVSSPPTRRGSSACSSHIQSNPEWDSSRSPSPTSSTASGFPTEPENVALYSKRPLPSLPSSAPSSRSTSISRLRQSRPRSHSLWGRRRFADCSSHDLLLVTCHHREKRSYEVEMTLGVIPKEGPSPLDLYARDMEQSYERIAVGVKRVVMSPTTVYSSCGKANSEEFEWMRQRKRFSYGRSKRAIEVFQVKDDGADADDEYEYERGGCNWN